MHIHVYAHKLYLPRSFVCIHGRGYRVHTCVYQAYATEVFMYCYWNLVHRIPAVVKVGTVSSLAAVVMTVSCATGAALSTYSNRRTPRSCGRYFWNILSCMYVRDFIVILLNTCYYICIYVSWRFLAKFYDMCNPEILCHCLFYLLFTCTLSEMMNKRCPIMITMMAVMVLTHWARMTQMRK